MANEIALEMGKMTGQFMVFGLTEKGQTLGRTDGRGTAVENGRLGLFPFLRPFLGPRAMFFEGSVFDWNVLCPPLWSNWIN